MEYKEAVLRDIASYVHKVNHRIGLEMNIKENHEDRLILNLGMGTITISKEFYEVCKKGVPTRQQVENVVATYVDSGLAAFEL